MTFINTAASGSTLFFAPPAHVTVHAVMPTFISSISDKLLHGTEYLIFGYLLARGLGVSRGWNDVLKVLLLGTGYGILDEFMQKFTPGRVCDIHDAMADGFGILVGVTIYLISSRLWAWRVAAR